MEHLDEILFRLTKDREQKTTTTAGNIDFKYEYREENKRGKQDR